jgi:hypothetical protein
MMLVAVGRAVNRGSLAYLDLTVYFDATVGVPPGRRLSAGRLADAASGLVRRARSAAGGASHRGSGSAGRALALRVGAQVNPRRAAPRMSPGREQPRTCGLVPLCPTRGVIHSLLLGLAFG